MFLKFISKQNKVNDLRSFTDEELVRTYKKSKNTKLIGELFDRYTHLVFGVSMKYLKDEEDSRDAVMQIFEDLHYKLSNHNISNFKSWVYSVTKNHCLMALRKMKSGEQVKKIMYEKTNREIMESAAVFHLNDTDDINDKIPHLKKGIEKLKMEQRTCIELLYLQNKSYFEVAEITGFDLKKVKSYIQNGKRNLKIFLEGNGK